LRLFYGFIAYFTVSLLVALYKFFERNMRFTFKTNSHLHDRSDLTAVSPTNTALYNTRVTHWSHEAGQNTTGVVTAGQELANKSALSSGHRDAETSRGVITTIILILDNKEEPTEYTGRFIMYSEITKIYYRKTVGHVFTKQTVQIKETTQFFSSKLFFIVVHISTARRCDCM
jgi:hypothetical protein